MQSRQSIRWFHKCSMEVDEEYDTKLDVWPQWIAAHAYLKIEFTEGNKCHNLMNRLKYPYNIIADAFMSTD